MDDAARIEVVKQYLRRKYTGGTTDGLKMLKSLADDVFNAATDPVTLTGQSFDGGSHSGQITFEKMAYLSAIEAVISELDTSTAALPPPPDRAYARFQHGVNAFPPAAAGNTSDTTSSS